MHPAVKYFGGHHARHRVATDDDRVEWGGGVTIIFFGSDFTGSEADIQPSGARAVDADAGAAGIDGDLD